MKPQKSYNNITRNHFHSCVESKIDETLTFAQNRQPTLCVKIPVQIL